MSIKFYELPIDEIRDETHDAYTVFFTNPDPEVFQYQAGQYLTLKLKVNEEELRRCFSLSSCPESDDRLAITIKRVEEGRVSNYIRDHLKKGDLVEVLPPMGNFVLTPYYDQGRNHIMISAGSGITPLMSMLKSALKNEPESVVTLWYGNRDEDSIIFKNQLIALSKEYPNRLHTHHTLSKPNQAWKGFVGRLDKEKIYDLISDLFMTDEHRKYYYICGPHGLMEAAEAAMNKHAINPNDVYREYYSASAPSDSDIQAVNDSALAVEEEETKPKLEPQEISLILNGETHRLTVEPTQSILDSAIEAKLDPPYACLGGICTSCRAFVNQGEVVMDETLGLSKEELKEGYILSCQAHPITDNVEVEFK